MAAFSYVHVMRFLPGAKKSRRRPMSIGMPSYRQKRPCAQRWKPLPKSRMPLFAKYCVSRSRRGGESAIVPRASEQAIEARYAAAVAALELRLDSAERSAQAAQLHALSEKMRLCHGLEVALVHSQVVDASYLEQWVVLPRLSGEIEGALQKRFSDVQAALPANDRSYAAMLEANRTQLSQEILRLEIVAGLESPAELSRERLKMQVEVLQSSLKMGHKSLSQDEQLYTLCALPAVADAQDSSRISHLLAKMGAAKI